MASTEPIQTWCIRPGLIGDVLKINYNITMKDNSKNKEPKKQEGENSNLSLQDEIIKTLQKKNEQKSGAEQTDQSGSKDKGSSGSDEQSVSWP